MPHAKPLDLECYTNKKGEEIWMLPQAKEVVDFDYLLYGVIVIAAILGGVGGVLL